MLKFQQHRLILNISLLPSSERMVDYIAELTNDERKLKTEEKQIGDENDVE